MTYFLAESNFYSWTFFCKAFLAAPPPQSWHCPMSNVRNHKAKTTWAYTVYTSCVHFETVHILYTRLITAHLCSVYTIYSIYTQCLLGHLVQPYNIHCLATPPLYNLCRSRKSVKSRWGSSSKRCTMKPPPLLAAHKIPEVPTNAQKLVLTRTLTTCPPFLFI